MTIEQSGGACAPSFSSAELERFEAWWMLQPKVPYRTPEEIARMAFYAGKEAAAIECDERANIFEDSPRYAEVYRECAEAIRAL